MTTQQAEKIVTAIFARFPRAHLSPAVLHAWAGSLLPYEYKMACETINGPVMAWAGEYPPPLNGLRAACQRKLDEQKKKDAPPEVQTVSEALGRSASSPVHRKYLRIIDHLWRDAPSHRYARSTGKFEAGNRHRIEARLIERYGENWWQQEAWDMQDGEVTPKGGTP